VSKKFRLTESGLDAASDLAIRFDNFLKAGKHANILNATQEDQDMVGLAALLATIEVKDPETSSDRGLTFRTIIRSMGADSKISLWKENDIRRFMRLAAEAGWLVESDDDEDLAPRPRRRSGRRLFTR